MKYLFAILISLMSVTPTSASDRIYNETGALPSTRADWERVGVTTLSDADILSSSSHRQLRSGLSCGILQLDILRTGEFPKLPDTSPEFPMSEVKDQGYDHGFCTAYAVSAVIEAITGIKVSEAELMLRLKTKGGDDRTCDGSHLYLFPQIIREGIVLEANFPTTADFKQYINIRKKMIKDGQYEQSDLFGRKADYKETIDEFIDWCQRSSKPVPTDLKPTWESELYTPLAETNFFFRGFVLFNAATNSNVRQIINTRHVVSPNSYYCVKFRMKKVAVFEPHHSSDDPFYKLKFSLVQRTPIAISIKTFAKNKLDADGKRVIEKTWLGIAPTLDNDYKIDLPTSEYERYGGLYRPLLSRPLSS